MMAKPQPALAAAPTSQEPPEDPAFYAAYHAAAAVSVWLGGSRLRWPSFGARAKSDETGDIDSARRFLAPFVRREPSAPVEALYICGRGPVHACRLPFGALDAAWSEPYATFASVLQRLDRALAKEAAAAAALVVVAPAPRRPSADDDAMEKVEGLYDRAPPLRDPRLRAKRKK